MRTILDLEKENLVNKKILLRVDFNVPSENGKVKEEYRLKAHKPTIEFLLNKGAKVALVSHVADSFSARGGSAAGGKEIFQQIGAILGLDIDFEDNILLPELKSRLTLFENIRKYEGEEKNEKEFAKKLAKNFDFYVNDAFSVSHRNHVSVSAVAEFLPSFAGFLLEKEVKQLSEALGKPAKGKTLIIGGGKVETKVPLVKNFLGKAEHILIGGAVANNFFKAKGIEIGKSVFDEKYVEELKPLLENPAIFIPEDFVISPDRVGVAEANPFPLKDIDQAHYILDIGPETAKHFSDLILNSEVVIWNGPMGQFETEAFSYGTKEIVKAISKTNAYSVIGGGDTISAFNKFGDIGKVDFVSTGGGAMLEFLAGNKLPGLAALGYYYDFHNS